MDREDKLNLNYRVFEGFFPIVIIRVIFNIYVTDIHIFLGKQLPSHKVKKERQIFHYVSCLFILNPQQYHFPKKLILIITKCSWLTWFPTVWHYFFFLVFVCVWEGLDTLMKFEPFWMRLFTRSLSEIFIVQNIWLYLST